MAGARKDETDLFSVVKYVMISEASIAIGKWKTLIGIFTIKPIAETIKAIQGIRTRIKATLSHAIEDLILFF